ncbi:pelota-like protein [Vairimorpha necatrix]|uniref:Pelota-like protein n=1 Tax=Vairimorpha necatrix TaxID=6039 RepID=A0AAX4J962_9MICR
MKILNESIDKKKSSGNFDLLPECPDDIYELSKIIVQNDKIKSYTHRKLSIDGRNQQKIGLILTIKLESFTADLENGILYAKGKVCAENEHVKLGSYHTLEIELDKKFSLYKDNWSKSDINILKEASKGSQNILLIIIYEKDAVLCLVGKNRIKIINKIDIKNKKFNNLITIISQNIDKVEFIILCSAINLLNDIKKFLLENIEKIKKQIKNPKINVKEKILDIKIPSEMKNFTNKQIVNYIFTDVEISKRFNNLKYITDIKEMSNYFLLFDRGNMDYLVGKKEIRESLDYGALDKIFFTDEFYRPHEIEKRRKIEDFCKILEISRVKIFIIPVNHLLGERLKEIGGVCGILKFLYK